MANKSIFEKTMQACRESVANAKNNSKKLTEKKLRSRSIKRESDEGEEDDEIMMDIQDDIVAVVDPDIDADEMTDVALGFQQLVDDAGANEVPETDEYLGNNIYGCPVCGQKFFSDKPMTDGGKCPVCGEEADGFVSIGEVDKAEDVSDEDSDSDEAKGDSEELDFADAEVEISDEKKKARRESARRVRRPMRKEGARVRRSARRPSMARESKRVGGLMIDEKTFNPHLNKFIRENYKNAMSFRVVGAKKKGNTLSLECAIRFKSGKTKKTTLVCNYNRRSNVMTAKDQGIFKVESKKAPFVFKVRTVGNVIRCEGMKYNFVTTAKVKNESKKIRVSSRKVTESRRIRRPSTRRALESRRAIRRPMRSARRVTESRKVVRRPLTRRTVESRRVRPAVRRVRSMESRRIVRRPMTRRAVENRRLATRRAVRSMRSESARLRKPITRRTASVRSESIRRARRVRGVRSESRMAKRNAIRRTARR